MICCALVVVFEGMSGIFRFFLFEMITRCHSLHPTCVSVYYLILLRFLFPTSRFLALSICRVLGLSYRCMALVIFLFGVVVGFLTQFFDFVAKFLPLRRFSMWGLLLYFLACLGPLSSVSSLVPL